MLKKKTGHLHSFRHRRLVVKEDLFQISCLSHVKLSVDRPDLQFRCRVKLECKRQGPFQLCNFPCCHLLTQTRELMSTCVVQHITIAMGCALEALKQTPQKGHRLNLDPATHRFGWSVFGTDGVCLKLPFAKQNFHRPVQKQIQTFATRNGLTRKRKFLVLWLRRLHIPLGCLLARANCA